jgi:hypothetical protein
MPRTAGDVQHGRVELHGLHVTQHGPREAATAWPSAVAIGGFVVSRNTCPAPPVARIVCFAQISVLPCPRFQTMAPARQMPFVGQQVDDEGPLPELGAAAGCAWRQSAARMTSLPVASPSALDHPPGDWCAAFRRGLARPAVLDVELGTHSTRSLQSARALHRTTMIDDPPRRTSPLPAPIASAAWLAVSSTGIHLRGPATPPWA